MSTLLRAVSISHSFTKPDNKKQAILDKISFELKAGEIVAIVGKSGSGKSTLLKIVAGLIAPTKGQIIFNRDKDDKNLAISMIFQTFALFPWLSVLENVELGLEAMDISPIARRERALKAIDLIGLDGFESAMPRELSGGMRQRVGFARALVVQPDIILMDEPFSALDILTSNNLKNDFLDLWVSKVTPIKSVIIVTHSIEEAVVMADRVFVFSSNPGRIIAEVDVTLLRPRNMNEPAFHDIMNKIYDKMTITTEKALSDKGRSLESKIAQKLPATSPNRLAAVAETLVSPPYNGSANIAELVKTININTSDILHITEALSLLKFATVTEGNIKINSAGKKFANADLEDRKKIFAAHLLTNVPLASYICKILHERSDRKASRSRFQTHLEDHLSHEDSNKVLKIIIAWGRYAEIFSYDDNAKIFSLDNPTASNML